jgi:hypothetical protein
MFLLRLLQVLMWLVLGSAGIILFFYAFSWVIIGTLEAFGYNNTMIVKWLRSKFSKRKKSKRK